MPYKKTGRNGGSRTFVASRDHTPVHNRSVLLTASRPVEPSRSRVGTTHRQPEPRRPSIVTASRREEGALMQVVHPICCGIDVHQACLRHVDAAGQAIQDVGEFATTYNALLALLDWFVEAHCPVVARESTGVY